MRLLFMRHGESTWNAEGRFQGRRDAPLSELGERQARALGERLAVRERPAAIVASPLERARRTAEFIGQRCGVQAATDERLIEICHGEWEGLLESEVAARWPVMIKQWHEAPVSVEFPGGESLLAVRARFDAFIGDLDRFRSPLAVVTHDVIVRLASLWGAHEPLERFFAMKTENAAITQIDVEDGRPTLMVHNDASHLEGLRSDLARQAL